MHCSPNQPPSTMPKKGCDACEATTKAGPGGHRHRWPSPELLVARAGVNDALHNLGGAAASGPEAHELRVALGGRSEPGLLRGLMRQLCQALVAARQELILVKDEAEAVAQHRLCHLELIAEEGHAQERQPRREALVHGGLPAVREEEANHPVREDAALAHVGLDADPLSVASPPRLLEERVLRLRQAPEHSPVGAEAPEGVEQSADGRRGEK